MVKNSRTFVPLKDLAKHVSLNDETLTVKAYKNEVEVKLAGKKIVFTIGSKTANVDDTEIILDAAPFVTANETYVPVNSLKSVFGKQVVWNQAQKAVAVTTTNADKAGETNIVDLDKTEENKAYVKGFVENILMGKNPNLLTSYFDGDNYIQHNPSITDGLSGLGAALQVMTEQGIEMKYDQIHQVIGQGNFVLVVSEGTFAGNHTAYYDHFRVENGKIAEHWDVLETIPVAVQHANQNGKF